VVKVPRNLEKTTLYSTLCSQRTDAFHVFDLDWLLESHELWKKNMPNIRPYYGERGWHAAVCSIVVDSCSQKVEFVASVTFFDHSSFTIKISTEYKLIS